LGAESLVLKKMNKDLVGERRGGGGGERGEAKEGKKRGERRFCFEMSGS
jgi:hypothetical protein